MHRTLFLILFLFTLPLLSVSANENVTLKKPPVSLKQWYKPDNKRNVFQHNMFKLRRELQAINQYRKEEDLALTQKWVTKFVEHYRKIADMVPEWKSELSLDRAEQLETGAKEGNYRTIARAIKKLQKNCRDCHDSYRTQVTAIYRVPDYSQINVLLDGSETDYKQFMKILMRDVNRIIIAENDNNKKTAKDAFKTLQKNMTTLRSSCNNCHEGDKAKDYYLGNDTTELMKKLETAIDAGNSGRPIGELAVEACAHCHGSHRINYDLKERIK